MHILQKLTLVRPDFFNFCTDRSLTQTVLIKSSFHLGQVSSFTGNFGLYKSLAVAYEVSELQT